MKLLLAGPDTSLEFGWLVAVWVPLVRKHSRGFDKTVIVCRKGNEYLYKDFCDDFHYYEEKGDCDRWLINGKKIYMPEKIAAAYPEAIICRPREYKCTKWAREYFKYGQEGESDGAFDIVFHARTMTKYSQAHLNYPVYEYAKMIRDLGIDPWRCASIGSVKGASRVPRTNDLRGLPMERLCRILAHSKVCVGTSSGPMHLASLCGCSQVVITGNEWQDAIKGTNRDRYKKLWNPFGTPCAVLDKHKWQPPVSKVLKAVGKFL